MPSWVNAVPANGGNSADQSQSEPDSGADMGAPHAIADDSPPPSPSAAVPPHEIDPAHPLVAKEAKVVPKKARRRKAGELAQTQAHTNGLLAKVIHRSVVPFTLRERAALAHAGRTTRHIANIRAGATTTLSRNDGASCRSSLSARSKRSSTQIACGLNFPRAAKLPFGGARAKKSAHQRRGITLTSGPPIGYEQCFNFYVGRTRTLFVGRVLKVRQRRPKGTPCRYARLVDRVLWCQVAFEADGEIHWYPYSPGKRGQTHMAGFARGTRACMACT